MTGPLIRILLRYLSGVLIAKGFFADGDTGKLAPVFRLGEVAQSLFSAPIALPLCGVIPFAVHRQPFTGCTDSGDQKWKPVLPMRHNTKSS